MRSARSAWPGSGRTVFPRLPNWRRICAAIGRAANGGPSTRLLGRIVHAVRQARAADDFRHWHPASSLSQSSCSPVTRRCSHSCRSARPRCGWATLFVSYVPLFVMLARDRLAARWHNPLRFHLWAVWAGTRRRVSPYSSATGSRSATTLPAASSTATSARRLNTLAFVVMGSVFAGRQYLLGLAWPQRRLRWERFRPAALIYAVQGPCSLTSGL